jgi:hypothetical protein
VPRRQGVYVVADAGLDHERAVNNEGYSNASTEFLGVN